MNAPDWAIKAACERMGLCYKTFEQDGYDIIVRDAIETLATYIAKHEERVDPLILEARELTAQYFETDECKDTAAAYRTGKHDRKAYNASHLFGLVYTVLKRGVEIGREQT